MESVFSDTEYYTQIIAGFSVVLFLLLFFNGFRNIAFVVGLFGFIASSLQQIGMSKKLNVVLVLGGVISLIVYGIISNIQFVKSLTGLNTSILMVIGGYVIGTIMIQLVRLKYELDDTHDDEVVMKFRDANIVWIIFMTIVLIWVHTPFETRVKLLYLSPILFGIGVLWDKLKIRPLFQMILRALEFVSMMGIIILMYSILVVSTTPLWWEGGLNIFYIFLTVIMVYRVLVYIIPDENIVDKND